MAITCPNCHSENVDTALYCSNCATSLTAPGEPGVSVTRTIETTADELARGTLFAGRYEIIEELGTGGMGKVYRAHDTKLNEEVALKLIKPEIAAEKRVVERFRNELKMARKITHKNVCRMYDFHEEGKTLYLTMEYVRGEDLKSLIHRMKALTVGAAVSVARQVAEGLSEAHKLGIVHRDLKPGNIMIDKEGQAKIMDFGIARSLAGGGTTAEGAIIGTPEYMSPEQVEGKEADQRSDIYSLGVILYEMATSHVPFEGETALSVAMKHKGELPKNPKQLNPHIPDDLGAVILKCLEKDRAKRYQSASEVRSELEKIEKGIPTTERVVPERKTITSREITVKFTLRKIAIPAIGFLILAAISLIIFRFIPKKQSSLPLPSGKPSLAVVYFENKTGDKSLDEWSTGLQELLVTDLSQSKFLRVLSGDKIYSILKKLNLHETKRYSTDDLVKVADEGAAEFTISGSFIKAGSRILVSATLQKPRTEDVIGNIRVECQTFDEITAKVDDLTKQIKTALNLTEQQIATDPDKNLGKITSSNSEALRYYVEAKRYHCNGEEDKAVPLLEKAVALDPEFILACEALSSAHHNLGENALNETYAAKTLDLIKRYPDRVPDKDRYCIEGRHYYFDLSDQFWPKAVEDLNKALDIDPEDSLANYTLGDLYNALEQWDKSLPHFNICLKNKFEFYSSYRNMATTLRAKGMPDQARETLEYYLKSVSDTAIGHVFLAYHYLTQGKRDLARQETDKAVILDPTYWPGYYLVGLIALLDGDLSQAEKEFSRLLAEKAPLAVSMGYDGLRFLSLVAGKFSKFSRLYVPFIEQMRQAGEKDNECAARGDLAYVYLKSGNPGKALDECSKAWAVAVGADYLNYQRDTLYLKGLAYLELKNIPEAEKVAEELKAVNARGMKKDVDIRIYDHLMGQIELEKKNYTGAIERLKKTVDSLPYGPLETDASYLDSLALAYFRAGEPAKAQTEYERITSLTTGRLDYGDLYAKAFYMLGKIAEQQGDKARAITNYRKFLDLWKEADPGLPEVEDARKRLARLTGS